MKVFVYDKANMTAVVIGFNKGHAVKILAKRLEELGITLSKNDPIEGLDVDEKSKGTVYLFERKTNNGS